MSGHLDDVVAVEIVAFVPTALSSSAAGPIARATPAGYDRDDRDDFELSCRLTRGHCVDVVTVVFVVFVPKGGASSADRLIARSHASWLRSRRRDDRDDLELSWRVAPRPLCLTS